MTMTDDEVRELAAKVLEPLLGGKVRCVPGTGAIAPEEEARIQAALDAAVPPTPRLRVVIDRDNDFMRTRELRFKVLRP